jgi:hypothetical protein
MLGAVGIVILCLFAGRFAAELLADRWWAAQFSPGAISALSRWHFWQLGLGAVGVSFATAWFVLQMLVVIRAVGSVQIVRDVGGLQFREIVRPAALRTFALSAGICLGIVTGIGIGSEWQTIVLALHGLTLGIAEPLLGRDAGWYVAQLPLWQLLHGYAIALSLLAFLSALMLYAIMGAIRVEKRRPAINDHARRHLGLLLALLALAIAWGFLLRTHSLVAEAGPGDPEAAFRRSALVGPALAGTALMVAALSGLWAARGRHALLAASWGVLGVAALVARTGVPLLVPQNASLLADSTMMVFEDSAFGLGSRGSGLPPDLAAAPLFDRAAVGGLFGDAASVRLVTPANVPVAGRTRPAWLALVEPAGGPATLVAIAADTAGAGGIAIAFRLGDSLSYPTLYPAATFGAAAVRPGAPAVALVDSGRGVATGSPLRRLLLAWATQSRLPFTADRVDWILHPAGRLERLAPFASWSATRAVVLDGRVVWLADGYVASRTFPLTPAEDWTGGASRLLRAGFLGVVEPETGKARIYLRPDAGALAAAWADIAPEMVLPAAALPPALLANAGPPDALAAVQARVLLRRLAVATQADPVLLGRGPDVSWSSAGEPMLTYPVSLSNADHLFAVILVPPSGAPSVSLLGKSPLGAPAMLERLWGRFVTFAPVQDSVAGAGAHTTAGGVHLWNSPQGLAAFEVLTAARPGARPAIIWVTVALPQRMGAGRTLALAWQNLLGNSVPIAPGQGSGTLDEARRWMRIADQALRSGDWEAFGRAFEALRGVLQTGD